MHVHVCEVRVPWRRNALRSLLLTEVLKMSSVACFSDHAIPITFWICSWDIQQVTSTDWPAVPAVARAEVGPAFPVTSRWCLDEETSDDGTVGSSSSASWVSLASILPSTKLAVAEPTSSSIGWVWLFGPVALAFTFFSITRRATSSNRRGSWASFSVNSIVTVKLRGAVSRLVVWGSRVGMPYDTMEQMDAER